MWELIRSSALWSTRPARTVYSARRRDVREFQSKPILAIEVAPHIDLAKEKWIDSAIAFSSHLSNIVMIQPQENEDHVTMGMFLDKHLKYRPRACLFIGKRPDPEEISALKLLEIDYRFVENPEPPSTETELPRDNPERVLWREAFDRRYVIYAHFERNDSLERLLDAYRQARLSFPDLLLVVSGLKIKDVPSQRYGYLAMAETKNKNHLQYADIMVLNSPSYQPLMSSLALVQIITQMRHLREMMVDALSHCTSLVLYDVHPKSLGKLAELAQTGMIWQVKKRESLGAALSQALSLENSANSAVQTLARVTQTDNELLRALDELAILEGPS